MKAKWPHMMTTYRETLMTNSEFELRLLLALVDAADATERG